MHGRRRMPAIASVRQRIGDMPLLEFCTGSTTTNDGGGTARRTARLRAVR
jgi:hypothetical protein